MNAAMVQVEERAQHFRARKNITWLLLFAIVMFFVALSSAYVVSKSSADYWVSFRMPKAFWYSTAVIVASSLTIQMALVSVRKGRSKATALWLVISLVLGVGFTFSQFAGWKELISKGYYLTDKILRSGGTYGVDYTIARQGVTLQLADGNYYLPDDAAHAKPLNAEMADYRNTSSSFFYVLTAGHWAHLLGGMIVLIVLVIKALMGRYSAEDHAGVWQGTMYWHFLTVLWIYLLLFLMSVH